jgi:hypothetical protein
VSHQELEPLIGEWEISVDIPGAEDMRGRAVFEWLYGGYLQHYFDSRGVVRLYAMTFEDRVWTLTRTKRDFGSLTAALGDSQAEALQPRAPGVC